MDVRVKANDPGPAELCRALVQTSAQVLGRSCTKVARGSNFIVREHRSEQLR